MQSSTTDFDLLTDGELFAWRSYYLFFSGTASNFIGALLKAACSLHAVSDQQSNPRTQERAYGATDCAAEQQLLDWLHACDTVLTS